MTVPGPAGGPYRGDASAFYRRVDAAAQACGVTRLADVTGLDRLGLPVWQAIRPAGRALSVHQGKGTTPLAAKIGALCEAIESHCAENAMADGPRGRFADFAGELTDTEPGDFCRDRARLPDPEDVICWCRAEDLGSGLACCLPHPFVSLDFTTGLPSPFERISGGLGAGPDEGDAILTGLLEVVERDALGEWQRRHPSDQYATSIALDSIPFAWFQQWRARLAELSVRIEVFQAPTIVDVHLVRCVIGGAEEFGRTYRRFFGASAHGRAEVALFKALAEALQSRLTLIAGVRDDILPSYYVNAAPPATPWPDGARPWNWAEPVEGDVGSIVRQLADAGYRRVLAKRLDSGLDGVAVAKVAVPGLGSLTRTRRLAA